MRDRKKSFRHHSLQDEKSLQDILKAVSSGIARGKITFSDEDEKIVPFDPLQKKKETKPFIRPTVVNAAADQPFGNTLDGPITRG